MVTHFASAAAILIALAFCGCASHPRGPKAHDIRVRHLPPNTADVIEAAIRMQDEPLQGHEWCTGLVDNTKPQTLGRYLASLISWQEQGDVNFVDVELIPRDAPAGMLWQATIMFPTGDGRDAYANYGVMFMIRQSDGLVLASSLVCPGTP
jgi:hypothetical protein